MKEETPCSGKEPLQRQKEHQECGSSGPLKHGSGVGEQAGEESPPQ